MPGIKPRKIEGIYKVKIKLLVQVPVVAVGNVFFLGFQLFQVFWRQVFFKMLDNSFF
jgi:hypothetical protein